MSNQQLVCIKYNGITSLDILLSIFKRIVLITYFFLLPIFVSIITKLTYLVFFFTLDLTFNLKCHIFHFYKK